MSQALQSFSYRQPECELSIQAKLSPLSQWLEQTILAELDFCLRIGNLQIKGDRQLLQELIIAVANYLEGYLQWDRVGKLASNHQISYGRWRKLELTTLELFDLHVVLEELTGQCQLLPKINASYRPVWLGMAAILIAVAGVGTWRITNRELVPQVSNLETPVAVRPEVPEPLLETRPVPPIASKDSLDPLEKTTPNQKKTPPNIQPQVPQPIASAPSRRSLNEDRKTDPQAINRQKIPEPSQTPDFISEPSSTPATTAPPMVNPTVSAESAVPPAPMPNLPQSRTPSVQAKLRIASLKKLTAINPGSAEIDYAKAIAQLNTQLNAQLSANSSSPGQKIAISEAIPRELALVLTAVKVENKQKIWLRAEPNQSNEVNQLVSLLQEAINRDSKIELPAGEYELLLQIVE